MTGPALFEAACVALYGDRWKTQAVKLLGVCKTSIRNWQSGRSPVPAWAWRVLRHEIEEREKALTGLHERVGWAAAGSSPRRPTFTDRFVSSTSGAMLAPER